MSIGRNLNLKRMAQRHAATITIKLHDYNQLHRQLDELKAKIEKLTDALNYCKSHEHTASPCDESGSHYSDLCETCKRIKAAIEF